MTRRFAAIFDAHVGFESHGGHKRPIHDPTAIAATLTFLSDFKPHDLIFGGDILDCSVISHHTKTKPRQREGFRLLSDAELCRRDLIAPACASLATGPTTVFIIGNHEAWAEDLVDEDPGLEGIVDVRGLLGLEAFDRLIPQGGIYRLGKLWFAHGDQIRGSEHVAKTAVMYYNRSIAFGHYHTYQTFTMTSAIDEELPKVGVAVPCLCRKDPSYTKSRPNRWAQGFAWGYSFEDGTFSLYISLIVRGKFHALGKTYKG